MWVFVFILLHFQEDIFKFGVVKASYSCLGASRHVSKADCFDGNMLAVSVINMLIFLV